MPNPIKSWLFALLVTALLGALAWLDLGRASTHSTPYTNPVLDYDFPDPSVLLASDGWYYAYATQSIWAKKGKLVNIQVARSQDLGNWEYLGDALPKKPEWASRTWNFWAPHVVFHDGLFILYYSAEPNGGGGLCLAVATSPNPAGPFTDRGQPLLCGPGFIHIDPMAFDDPQTGKRLLYWGSGFAPIRVQELAPDRLSFLPGSSPTSVLEPGGSRPYEYLVEGGWVIYRSGTYYLFYSGDACCGRSAHYAVMVARAKSAFGPFEKLGDSQPDHSSVILESNSRWKAPGHNAIFQDAAGQDWIFYHAINAIDPEHNDFTPNDDYFPRVMLLDRILYKDGWPYVAGGTPSTTQQAGPEVR